MKKSNKLFVLTGCILIAVILAYKFGMFDKIRMSGTSSSKDWKLDQANSSASGVSKQETNTNPVSISSDEKTSADLPVEKNKTEPEGSAPVQNRDDIRSPVSASAIQNPEIPDSSKKEQPIPGIGDPFSYAAQNADENYPMSGGEKKLGSISVKGIVRLKGTAPVAILHLKDTGRNYYVSRGDVIRITENGGKSAAPLTEAYVVIKDVRDEEVELVQQERPDKVIIVR
jgi:hypothetical protein